MSEQTIERYEDMSREDLIECCKAHDAHHQEHHEREEELKDLLQSAQAIARRNGEGTHWRRFTKRLEEFKIYGVTAKSFRVLPHDIEVGDDGRHQ